MDSKSVSLKVLEAYTRDVGRGVARFDYSAINTLDTDTGEIIEIKGKRKTVVKCLPLYPADEGRGVIRIDGLIRSNAGVSLGDSVTITRVKAV
ncbi:MAG: AAA family ATPase, partial [Rhabdochlamydiaceae bacterium]